MVGANVTCEWVQSKRSAVFPNSGGYGKVAALKCATSWRILRSEYPPRGDVGSPCKLAHTHSHGQGLTSRKASKNLRPVDTPGAYLIVTEADNATTNQPLVVVMDGPDKLAACCGPQAVALTVSNGIFSASMG